MGFRARRLIGFGADGLIGALIIRIALWGPFYYTYNKKAPK